MSLDSFPPQGIIKTSDITLGSKLGEGALGAVFEGTYLGHKKVAIKRMLEGTRPTPEIMRLFESEAKVWFGLNDENSTSPNPFTPVKALHPFIARRCNCSH